MIHGDDVTSTTYDDMEVDKVAGQCTVDIEGVRRRRMIWIKMEDSG